MPVLGMDATETHPTFEGDVTLTFWQADVTLYTSEGTRTYRTGVVNKSNTVGAEAYGYREQEIRILTVKATNIRGILEPGEGDGITLTAADAVYMVDGSLRINGARGSVEYGGTRRALTDNPVELFGRFEVTPTCDPSDLPVPVEGPACAYEVRGNVDRVMVAGHPVFARPGAAATGLALLGAALLALLARLWQALQAFGSLVPTRIRPRDVVHHPVRKKILHVLESAQALHFSALARAAGLASGGLTHHLKILVRHGHVRSRNVGRQRFYWLADRDLNRDDLWNVAVLSAEQARRYARIILERPGLTQKEISEREGRKANNVNYHLRRLRVLHLVRTEKEPGRGFRYYPTEELRELLESYDVVDRAPPAPRGSDGAGEPSASG